MLNAKVLIESNLKAFSAASVFLGVALVIYYCSSISFYPTGLTVGDTLFFVWAIVIFGFIYSVVSSSFMAAGFFWLSVFSKPINFIIKKARLEISIFIPMAREDRIFFTSFGFFANFAIIAISYFKGHPLVFIFGTFFLSGVAYVLLSSLKVRSATGVGIVDSKGIIIGSSYNDSKMGRSLLWLFIFLAPLIVGQVSEGVVSETFKTMGIRQENVTIYLDSIKYEPLLGSYLDEGLISGVVCESLCAVDHVDILFAGIGDKTKLRFSGGDGYLLLSLPAESIEMVAKKELAKKHN